MNIVWLTWKDRTNPLAGGAEVIGDHLAQRLAADGHRVTMIVGGYPGAAAAEARHGYQIVRVGGRLTTYVAAARYYRAHRAQLAPDLVIDECNTLPYLAGWYAGVRVVPLFHMLCRQIWFYEMPLPLSLIGWLFEPLYLRLVRPRTAITVSDSTRRDLMRAGFPADRISVISEAIELAPAPNLDIAKYPQPTLLSLGAQRSMKRTLHQIRAFELAKPHHPTLQLKVAGPAVGRYGRRVQAAIRASPYASDIEYLGAVSLDVKRTLMQRCHAILVTSVKEGWGLIVTEAASQGTPAIVYDVDGLRDSVRPGQTGLITPTNTPAGLATAISQLLDDPAHYRQLRQAAWRWSHELTFDHCYADFVRALNLPSHQS
ncbi:MAG TPA: glycosyltransferase family 4 protein [Candidatus Saccharimonas sp.]|nr:glycosyltransferase family 4 protein [Candidatus Saccharimonas sp.]